ncbi:MAG: C40 family peptidase [Firmicutes bacterium]|nr:C40 family peptidase [Bacillota bacterium]
MDGLGKKLMILLLVVLLAFAAVSVFKSLHKSDSDNADSSASLGSEQSVNGEEAEKEESTPDGRLFLEKALKHVGGYYKRAGTHLKNPDDPDDENIIDCTGLVQELYKKYCGIKLTGGKHTNMIDKALELGGEKVKSPDDLYVGDLLFYRSDEENNRQHVAIYAGGGDVLDASPDREGRDGVYVRSLSTAEPYEIIRLINTDAVKEIK